MPGLLIWGAHLACATSRDPPVHARGGEELALRRSAGPPQTVGWKIENLKKVAWEGNLGQNSLKVLNHRGLRSCCPLETLPHTRNPCEFGLPAVSLGSGRGQSIFGSSLTQLVQREKAWFPFGWRDLKKHPNKARFNWWTAKSLWIFPKTSKTPGGQRWEQESCAPSSSTWVQVAQQKLGRCQKSQEIELEKTPYSLPPLQCRLYEPAWLQTRSPRYSHPTVPQMSWAIPSFTLRKGFSAWSLPIPAAAQTLTSHLTPFRYREQITRDPCSRSGYLTAMFLFYMCEMAWQESGNLLQWQPIFFMKRDEILHFWQKWTFINSPSWSFTIFQRNLAIFPVCKASVG